MLRLALLFLLIGSAFGQTAEHITPAPQAAIAEAWQFSPAVRVGNMVWVSGQVGMGANGMGADAAAQSVLALDNLAYVLSEAGASLSDVVELTSYHVGSESLDAFRAAKAAVFTAAYPAWTAVEVSGLAALGLVVEVKAVAVIGSAGE
ncbi:MAG: Rid family hydrolase [Bacteroidota bacterium]